LTALVRAGVIVEAEAVKIAWLFAVCPYESKPFPSYAASNLRVSIRKDRGRIEEIERKTRGKEHGDQ